MSKKLTTVLDPSDEYTHTPDSASNYNESMYLNGFDVEREIGAWFRLGNRPNEGYAEMTVCVYLPGGRVGFVFGRPQIDNNDQMSAGGLTIDVVEPFKHLTVRFNGKICVLDNPLEMAEPRTAFKNNPWVECEVALDFEGVSPMFGGRPVYEDGTEPDIESETSFFKAHYEQHCAVRGTIRVGDETVELDGLGLRDKSWGPRYWQAIEWYRWLPIVFSPEFVMMISVVGGKAGGVVLVGEGYHHIRSATITSEWDEHNYQRSMSAVVSTDHDTYEVTGEVLSLIPLRNRRADPDGNELQTRITEAMTRFTCNGQRGIGMSEYLDQIIDGRPVGPDVA